MKKNSSAENNRENQRSQAKFDNYSPRICDSYKYITRPDGQKLNAQDKVTLNLLLEITKEDGYAIIDYHFLEERLEKTRSTVKRTLEHLSHIFTREFHTSLLINGRKECNKLIITRTPESQEILSTAKRGLNV